ncbi:hypothetical protein [Bradyrhizobium sp. ARR65]|nr:hypothetical protein [Bradyrhizobium sp. ARR65]
MLDMYYATLLEAADAVRSRNVSPVELTRGLLERIGGPRLSAGD